MKYTEEQINAYLNGIFEGSIDEHNLPEDLYTAITGYLQEALYKGFGSSLETAEGGDLALLSELRDNVYMFGAAKTYQETKAISEKLIDDEGNIRSQREFLEVGRAMFSTWNDDWGKSEYNTAIAQATMASKWSDIQEQKHLFPKLRYSTIGDACDICGPLDNLVAPIDDPVWDDIYPANHFNCRCTVLQEDEDVPDTPADEKEDIHAGVVEKMDETFINNAGKTGSVFPEDHPYFKVPEAERDFAADNFGLPMPEPTISEVMEMARESGPEVDALGKKWADKYDGKVTPVNYKSEASIRRKVDKELLGDITQLKDAVRNTVVVDYNKLDEVSRALKKDPLFSVENGGRVKLQSGDGYFGYKGIITNYKAENGLTVEMQVNSPGMIYAKVDRATALNVLTEAQYNEIATKTGLEGGLGHKYYEEIRSINKLTASAEDLDRMEKLIKKSEKYYAKFYGF